MIETEQKQVDMHAGQTSGEAKNKMIIKCKICGGDMEVSEDNTFGVCKCCGCTMTLPKVNDDQKAAAFNRGNHFRMSGEFDKALQVYEHIISEDDTDAEAHWCAALCRFGIEWVEDPATMEYLPTCHRASFDLFTNDVDYLAALEHSDGITKRQYQKDAAKIVEVQRGILATSQNEKPFDVFICYKETDENGQRTVDSMLAQDIYYQLTDQGLRVFFARITLEDKAGSEYEPYIFAALHSAKAMVVVGTKPEHFNAVWVKNEWSRYLSLVKHDRNKVLLPCYRDMDPYDLPEQLSVLQSYDMSKIGFIQDLIRGIKKITVSTEPKLPKQQAPVGSGSTYVAPLLDRAFLFLEDGNWEEADAYCEKVLDQDPRNADAYLGKLMAELKVRTRDSLADCDEPFDDNSNYQKAVRFGDTEFSSVLEGYVDHIKERNENNRLKRIYENATREMQSAGTEAAYNSAASLFKTIRGFKDADVLAGQCDEKADICRKNAIYSTAENHMAHNTVLELEAAIGGFRSIPGWRDADAKVSDCGRMIEKIKEQNEAEKKRQALEAEERRQAHERAAKKRKKAALIIVLAMVVLIAATTVVFTVVIPSIRSAEQNRIFEAQKENIKNLSVGDVIKFGVYEQDNNTRNGKEEIEWQVLAIEDNKALLISKYALECNHYNSSYTSVTWENSTIREWMNEVFLKESFGIEHQKRIVDSTVSADKNPSYNTSPGNDQIDKVFLLSITEAVKYYHSDEARRCAPTAYALAQGIWTSDSYQTDGKSTCQWWLRSPGYNNTHAAYVNIDGVLNTNGSVVTYTDSGIRPALWINLE